MLTAQWGLGHGRVHDCEQLRTLLKTLFLVGLPLLRRHDLDVKHIYFFHFGADVPPHLLVIQRSHFRRILVLPRAFALQAGWWAARLLASIAYKTSTCPTALRSMESAAKASTVNGTPQKTTKHQGTRLETDVQGNGYDRAETIEDIISELNATARKDTSLAEAFGDVTLDDDGQKSLDALDQWDPVSDLKTSSSKTDGGELSSAPASTLDEAKSAAVLTDASFSGEGESIVAFKPNETDSQDASKAVEAANGGTDQHLEGKKASECSSTLETDAVKKSVNEGNGEEPSGAAPNITVAGGCADEIITSDIKAPDEAVVSPRRTGRQRTASLKVTESATTSPIRKRRHCSEASDGSPLDPSSKNQQSKQGCGTSDSEADVPLPTRKLRKPSAEGGGTSAGAKIIVLTFDTHSGSPPAKLKRSPKLAKVLAPDTEGNCSSPTKTKCSPALVKRLASNSEGGSSPLAKMKRSPKLAKILASESESDSSPLAIIKRSPKLAKRLASDSEGGSPLVKRKCNPKLSNKLVLESASSTSPLAIAKGSAKVAKKPPEYTETEENDVQSVEPPSKKKLRRILLKDLTEDEGTKGRGPRSPELNGTKRGKPMDSKKAQNLASKAKRKAVHEEELPLSDSTTPVGHSSDEGAAVSCRLSKPKKAKGKAGSSMEGASVSVCPVSKKTRPLVSKDSSAGLNAADVSGSGVTYADGNHFTMLNSLGHSAEAAQLWLPGDFISSDRNLQESVKLSVRRWEPPARPSYLAIEVPSVAAGRAWGPPPNRQRPTVVFGGCDPMNTYVNIHGVRVLLHQLQKVLSITPAIRLTDIFQCFKRV